MTSMSPQWRRPGAVAVGWSGANEQHADPARIEQGARCAKCGNFHWRKSPVMAARCKIGLFCTIPLRLGCWSITVWYCATVMMFLVLENHLCTQCSGVYSTPVAPMPIRSHRCGSASSVKTSARFSITAINTWDTRVIHRPFSPAVGHRQESSSESGASLICCDLPCILSLNTMHRRTLDYACIYIYYSILPFTCTRLN